MKRIHLLSLSGGEDQPLGSNSLGRITGCHQVMKMEIMNTCGGGICKRKRELSANGFACRRERRGVAAGFNK
jgi:hypothetical protein